MTVESGIFSLLHRIRQMFSSARKQGLVVRKQTPSQTSESTMTGNAQSGADVERWRLNRAGSGARSKKSCSDLPFIRLLRYCHTQLPPVCKVAVGLHCLLISSSHSSRFTIKSVQVFILPP